MLEKTLVILKPCTLQRGLVGEITHRFERKGLRLAGMKMMQLTDELLSEHYAHLSSKAFLSKSERFHDDSLLSLFVVSKVWMLFKLSVRWRVRQMDVWLPRNYSWGLQYEAFRKI